MNTKPKPNFGSPGHTWMGVPVLAKFAGLCVIVLNVIRPRVK